MAFGMLRMDWRDLLFAHWPLAPAAIDAIARVAAGSTNLEYDLERGERGSRYVHCVDLLREQTLRFDAAFQSVALLAHLFVLRRHHSFSYCGGEGAASRMAARNG